MEPDETKIWFYIKDRQQNGPIGLFELTKLFEQGVLSGETYLWTAGADYWQRAKTIDGFKNLDPSQSAIQIEMGTQPSNKPVVRFMAKIFDLSLFTVLLSTFISIFSVDLILKTSKITLFIIYFILWTLLEPIMLSIFGTTIGKTLLNLKIKCVNGDLLDFLTAFKRNLFIFTSGKGIGYPFIILLFNHFPVNELRKKTRSIWDQKAGTIVLYGSVSLPRKLVGFCFPLAVFITGIILS